MNSNPFIERSLAGTVSFLRDSIFADEYARRPGFLQSLDPRVKAAGFLLLIVAALFSRNISACLFIYSFSLALAFFSGIHLGFFLKRTWIFIPVFSLFIALPAIFSVFTPGEAVFNFEAAGLHLVITRQGLGGALLFVARVVTSVSFIVLLSITTRHFAILKVLRFFGIPQVFVMILGMCYRYIYLMLELIGNTYLAIKSRVGGRVGYKKGQHVVAWNVSSLWQRSYYLNEAVYGAMLSRGYSGEPKSLDDLKAGFKDWAFLSVSAGISLTIIIGTMKGPV